MRRPATLLIAVVFAAALPLQASDLWVHLRVDERGAKDTKVTVNLPLSLMEIALAQVPQDELRNGKIYCNGSTVDLKQLREMWLEVKRSGEANFVTVDSSTEKIRVSRRGEYLVVSVLERGDRDKTVDMRVPIRVVDALLGNGDQVNLSAAMQALALEGEGELLVVNDEQATVRLWVDNAPEGRGR